MAQQIFVETIYNAIKDAIGDEVTGVFEFQAPQNAQLPFVTFNIISDTLGRGSTMQDDNTEIEFTVDLYGHSRNGSKALRKINDNLYDYINRSEPEITGYDNNRIFITNRGFLDSSEDVLHIASTYELFGFLSENPSG